MNHYIPGNMVANSWFSMFIRNKALTFSYQKRVVDGLANVHDGRGAEQNFQWLPAQRHVDLDG